MSKTYVISCKKYHKIGSAVNVDIRKSILQIGNPFPLTICKVIDMDVESFLHEKFAEYRISGEWFLLPAGWKSKIDQYIKDLLENTENPLSVRTKHPTILKKAERLMITSELEITLSQAGIDIFFWIKRKIEDNKNIVSISKDEIVVDLRIPKYIVDKEIKNMSILYYIKRKKGNLYWVNTRIFTREVERNLL